MHDVRMGMRYVGMGWVEMRCDGKVMRGGTVIDDTRIPDIRHSLA